MLKFRIQGSSKEPYTITAEGEGSDLVSFLNLQGRNLRLRGAAGTLYEFELPRHFQSSNRPVSFRRL